MSEWILGLVYLSTTARAMRFKGSGVETMFMATAPTHSFLSSSLVKELAYYGGDVSSMVPEIVNTALKSRVQEGGK
jgi:pantetheine-phosphate adenylyltransferase